MIKKFIKKLTNTTKNSFILCYFLLISLFLLPNVITMPSHSFKNTIITAIGIDKIDDDIMVSVLAMSDISINDKGENSKMISGKSTSVANALNDIESQVGREVKLGHVGYIVISNNFASNDIASVLDYLIITTYLPNTVPMVMCGGNAQDILVSASKLESTSSYKLKEIIKNEFSDNFTKDTNVDSFLKGYYSETKTSTIGYIELTDIIEDGIADTENSGSQDNKNNQSGQNQKTKIISLKREHAVFVSGKFKYLLTKEEMNGINWLVKDNINRYLTIDNVNSQNFENAKITFAVISSSFNSKVSYKNSRPTIEYDIKINFTPIEVLEEKINQLTAKNLKLDDEIKNKVSQVVKKQISTSLKKLISEKTDVINCYSTLKNKNYKKFNEFLNSLQNKDDFLSDIIFKINVSPKIWDD